MMAYDFDNVAMKIRSSGDIVADLVAVLPGLDVATQKTERRWRSCRLPTRRPRLQEARNG